MFTDDWTEREAERRAVALLGDDETPNVGLTGLTIAIRAAMEAQREHDTESAGRGE